MTVIDPTQPPQLYLPGNCTYEATLSSTPLNFPADGGNDVSAMGSLVFAIRVVGEPAVESLCVALHASTNKVASNEVDLVRVASGVRDGAWHEVVVPMASLLEGSAFNARKAWEIEILTWSKGTHAVDIYLDEIGFVR